MSAANQKRFLYFGGQLILEGGYLVVDRLGSVRYREGSPGTRYDYWPYGEEKSSATTQGLEKFGTYERDHTGLDYADQRFFTNANGRFVTPDPAGSGTNWYAYVGGDPVNNSDPTGLEAQFMGFACDPGTNAMCSMMLASQGWDASILSGVGGAGGGGGGGSPAPLTVFANDLSQGGITGIQFQSADATFAAINSGVGNGYDPTASGGSILSVFASIGRRIGILDQPQSQVIMTDEDGNVINDGQWTNVRSGPIAAQFTCTDGMEICFNPASGGSESMRNPRFFSEIVDSTALTAVVAVPAAGAAEALLDDIAAQQSSRLFGTTFNGNNQLFNNNNTLRIGWSYWRSTGEYNFRIGGNLVRQFVEDGHIWIGRRPPIP